MPADTSRARTHVCGEAGAVEPVITITVTDGAWSGSLDEWRKRGNPLRAQLEAAEAEVARLNRINSDLCRVHNQRINDTAKLEARAEAAEAEVARLESALAEIAEQDAAWRPGWVHWSAKARHALAARTKEAAP